VTVDTATLRNTAKRSTSWKAPRPRTWDGTWPATAIYGSTIELGVVATGFEHIRKHCSMGHIRAGHDYRIAQAGGEEVSVGHEDRRPGDACTLGLRDGTPRERSSGSLTGGDQDTVQIGQVPEVLASHHSDTDDSVAHRFSAGRVGHGARGHRGKHPVFGSRQLTGAVPDLIGHLVIRYRI
jgi:hypothetical protein